MSPNTSYNAAIRNEFPQTSELLFKFNWKSEEKQVEKECGQQVKGGDFPSLLCPGEPTFRLLCPVLGSLVQERQESFRRSPAEDCIDMWGLEHHHMRKGWETWDSSVWRSLRRDLTTTYEHLKHGSRGDEDGIFLVVSNSRTRDNGQELHHRKFCNMPGRASSPSGW